MTNAQELERGIWEEAPETLQVHIQRPEFIPDADDSLEFHAARLLLLIYYAGAPRAKRIVGRTKLAKMDFLIRYPTYLIEAARIKKVHTNIRPVARPESRMIRYKYGPWDERYYDIFAYLVAKDFVEIRPRKSQGDIFQLTEKGKTAAEELEGPEFDEIVERCKLTRELFGKVAGSTIKNFIYRYFTDILDKPLGAEIEGNDVSARTE
jgi:hypothetical protein